MTKGKDDSKREKRRGETEKPRTGKHQRTWVRHRTKLSGGNRIRQRETIRKRNNNPNEDRGVSEREEKED